MNFNGILLRLATTTDTASLKQADSSIVFALFADMALLEALDACPGISSILAMPKHLPEIRKWILKWNAMDLRRTEGLYRN